MAEVAHHEGEEKEQTAEHVAALQTELAGQEARAANDGLPEADRGKGKSRVEAVLSELERFGVKRTRLRGEGR